jgi:hypothetical protein
MVTEQTFHDLAKLALQRCQIACGKSLQLLDDDRECAALLLAVAADLIYGASSHIDREDRAGALATALRMMIENLSPLLRKPKRKVNS